MRILITISSDFGKSALGVKIEQLTQDRAKRGLAHVQNPIEFERHLFNQPMDLCRVLSYVGGTNDFVDGNVNGVVGVVLTYHPYSKEVSICYLLGPNDSVNKDASRSLIPAGYSQDQMYKNYADYVSQVDHMWQRLRML